MDKKEFVIQELIRAIQAEKWGYEFYLSASKVAKDLRAKQVFLKLTQDEVEHQISLKKMLDNVGEDWSIEELSPEPMAGLNLPSIEQITNSNISDKEALEIGIKMEQKAFSFYMDLRKMIDDAEDKNFLKKLADIEKEHLASLQNIYSAINGKHYREKKG